MEFIHVEEVKYLGGHRLWLRFNDGASGEIDLSGELNGPIFQPLKDEEAFSKVRVEGGTIEWENGADLAPEYLRNKLAEQAA